MRLVLVTSLPCIALALASAQTATTDPVRLAPVTVEAPLLTESPATRSAFDLAGTPAAEATPTTLADRWANFSVGANGAHSFNDTYTLRGLANTPIFGGPALGVYLDDLPLGPAFTIPTDLAGFTRAELHRGPAQNTVFGRAGSAGVLALHTPTGTENSLRFAAGSDGLRRGALFAGATTGALDTWAGLTLARRDGLIENVTLGHAVDHQASTSGLARIRYQVGEGADLTLLVTALRARDGAQPLVPLGGPLFAVARAAEGETDLDARNAALTAAFATPLGRLSLTTSRTDWDLSPYANTLAFAPGFELTNLVRQRHRAWNEEIKLASPAEPGPRWQAGVFGSTARTDGAFDRFFGPFPYERSSYRAEADDLAAFGEATLAITPALRLTAGLRAETSRRALTRTETVPTAQAYARSRQSSALLPKLGLSHAVTTATTLFATAGAGYKPGGYSAFTGNRTLAAFGPERTRTLEAGITHTARDGRVTATVRTFGYAITGYQIERSFATGSAADDYLVVNAPRARSIGAELEVAWRPADAWVLSADAGLTRVTLREFADPFTGARYDGNRAPYAPAHDLSLRLAYQPPRGWFGGLELTRQGRVFYTEDENPAFAQPAVTLLGAELGYATGRFKISAYGRNLTDEGYYRAITPGTGHGTPGAPCTVGTELTVRF